MRVRFHPHAQARAAERGATEEDVIDTAGAGERFPARLGRTGFRRNFSFGGYRRGKRYETKQVEVYAVQENEEWLVITVLVKFF